MMENPDVQRQMAAFLTGRTIGRFVIGERLGKGGMGEVYRAEDTRLKRTVAIKRLSPGLRTDPLYCHRFQEEAERVSRFTDSHVAAVYDVIEQQDEVLLVMEFVEGQTLRQRLRDPMSLEQFLQIALQCAEGLVAAHERGIVHCDIKPENIMLTTSGQVKILDFGLAKHLPRSDQSSTIDRSGTVGGTPAYMSPEVLLEKIPDGRADIFSLGIVLYEALTGHHPFRSDSYVATTHRVLHEKPTPISVFNPKAPEELESIVNHMLAKDPAERYADARDLLDDLRMVQQGVTPSKLLPRPLIAPARRRRWLWAVTVLLIVAASYGTYRWLHTPPVFKERGWVLISDFDSSGEDPINDKGVREGLTIALQQSPYVNVYPRTRVYETLQRMKRSDVTRIDEALGREICRRENLQGLLAGSIEHIGSAFQMTVRAVDPNTGNLLFAEKEHFKRKEEFFDEVDKLARNVRRDLGESLIKIENSSRPLAKVTTSSPDALQLYSEAADYLAQGKMGPVEGLLKGALQIDPDFAMAHLRLGNYYAWIVGKNEQATSEWRRAYDLRQGVTDREQRRIEADFYQGFERYDEAAQSLSLLVSLYPDDAEAHEALADAYANAGQVDKAISELRGVLRTNPFSAHANSRLVLYLARLNREEEAITAYRDSQQRGVDSPELYWGLGLAYLGQGNAPTARQQFQHLEEGSETDRDLENYYLAVTDLYEGRLKQARAELETQLRTTPGKKDGLELARRYLLGRVYLLEGNAENASLEADRILAAAGSSLKTTNLQDAGVLYARAGSIDKARQALRRLDDVRKSIPSSWNKSNFYNLEGEIWLTEANFRRAESSFLAAIQEYSQGFSHAGLARAYRRSNRLDLVVGEWQAVLAAQGETLQYDFPPDLVLARLELARAYRDLNQSEQARKEYGEVLRTWQHADDLSLLRRAKSELRELSNRTTD